MKLLLDTSAILALIWKRDQHHRAARQFVATNPRVKWTISDLLLTEAATRIRARESAERTVEVVRELMGAVEDIVFVDPEILNASLELMGRYHDKRLSLADCSSFVLIERLGLQGAFTFDRDFRDCGFVSHPPVA